MLFAFKNVKLRPKNKLVAGFSDQKISSTYIALFRILSLEVLEVSDAPARAYK